MTTALAILASIYLLWVLFLAVMSLARAKSAGTLSRLALVIGTPILLVGFALDVAVNFSVMTILLMEFPRELTVSERLKRHNGGTGWRHHVARFCEQFLDPFDPRGDHI